MEDFCFRQLIYCEWTLRETPVFCSLLLIVDNWVYSPSVYQFPIINQFIIFFLIHKMYFWNIDVGYKFFTVFKKCHLIFMWILTLFKEISSFTFILFTNFYLFTLEIIHKIFTLYTNFYLIYIHVFNELSSSFKNDVIIMYVFLSLGSQASFASFSFNLLTANTSRN